ncbi:phosphorylase [Methanosarcina sp. Z-7115]|uniref:Phosphorylase n=1 Tax=Methanosarcina baikalica TaxID=3073890 RepID=A0ABU2CY96_9EURY|nr:phosphorylase [Methanosarcina sp. Z-7115]MDR7664673.1 phosphorylase [Methanosarcina sp. Z-7115]
MNDENWKRSLETFEIAYCEYAPGARRNVIQLFPQVTDKQKAWEELVALTAKMLINEDYRVISCMPLIFSLAFPHVPNKEKAWLDITKLVDFKESKADETVKNSMISIFSNSPDKEKAWADLLRFTRTTNKNSLRTAAKILCLNIVSREDKHKAWEYLIRLIKYEETEVKTISASNINYIFPNVCDKHTVWEDLIELIHDKNIQVKKDALNAVVSNYTLAPEKQKVWESLVKFSFDKDSQVKTIAANGLVNNFLYVPDKQKAWNDLIKVTSGDYQVRRVVANFLKSAILTVDNKEAAWEDLLTLSAHKDIDVRNHVSSALVFAFHLISDKQKLSQDLHNYMKNEDRNIKATVTSIISFVYSQLPDRQQFWEELIELTSDEDIGVRRNAYYSLGKISIFKASQAENEIDYRREFEQAIKFFEKTSQESTLFNPSQFCLPFYRSFYTIISDEKQQTKGEVDKYLTEARIAIKRSKNKQLLIEAVENLAKALEEVQSLENKSLESKKDELSLYMEYCEQAADLMSETEQTSPYATEVLRKGLPILNRKLKSLLKEIKEKAKIACQESKGTATEEITYTVSREVQRWEISSQEEMTQKVEGLIFILKSKIPDLPKNEYIFTKIDNIKDEKDILKQYESLELIIGSIPTIQISGVNVIVDCEQTKPTIGIITALPKEFTAVKILLENQRTYKVDGKGAGRRYCLGEIASIYEEKYNIVLSTIGMGNNIAASRASLLLEHFPKVESIIMVGIAGGVPDPKNADNHVRLGDIVVSGEKGVIQYDFIKEEREKIEYKYSPKPPSASLLEAVRYLEAEEIEGNSPWMNYINQALSKLKIISPSGNQDQLYGYENGEISHPFDSKRTTGQPRVFIGPIASANKLLKNPVLRDELRDKFKVKAIEMEASGIADATWNHEVGYLVVRGICDYCDSHKNDEWQQYAAVVAAAYTRALIESMP